jgi:hypothetical protein
MSNIWNIRFFGSERRDHEYFEVKRIIHKFREFNERLCGLVVKSSWQHDGDVLCFM